MTSPAQPGPLISVIVPIYKVEPYLRQCIESILAQTYTNLEVILVDNESPDNCPAICDEFAARDSRVRVLHKSHGAISSTSYNAGQAIASGELIGYVDGDDFILPTMYERLYTVMAEHNADVAICGYAFVDEGGNVKTSGAPDLKNGVYSVDGVSPLAILNLPTGCWATVWNKLYRRGVVVPLPEKIAGGDTFVFPQVVRKCACVVTVHDDLYRYVQHRGNASRSPNISKLDACEIKRDIFVFCKENKLKRAAGYTLITTMFICLFEFKHLYLRDRNDRKRLWRHVRWVSAEILKHPIWFGSVLWPETLRYIKKVNALKA